MWVRQPVSQFGSVSHHVREYVRWSVMVSPLWSIGWQFYQHFNFVGILLWNRNQQLNFCGFSGAVFWTFCCRTSLGRTCTHTAAAHGRSAGFGHNGSDAHSCATALWTSLDRSHRWTSWSFWVMFYPIGKTFGWPTMFSTNLKKGDQERKKHITFVNCIVNICTVISFWSNTCMRSTFNLLSILWQLLSTSGKENIYYWIWTITILYVISIFFFYQYLPCAVAPGPLLDPAGTAPLSLEPAAASGNNNNRTVSFFLGHLFFFFLHWTSFSIPTTWYTRGWWNQFHQLLVDGIQLLFLLVCQPWR